MDIVTIRPQRVVDGRQLSSGNQIKVTVVKTEAPEEGYALKVLVMHGEPQTNLRVIVPKAGGDPFEIEFWSSANEAGGFAKKKGWLIAE